MRNIWFTSDWHLGHANLVKRGFRKFSSVDEMDIVILGRFHSRVKKGDDVYFLGDFSWGGRDHVEKQWRRHLLPYNTTVIFGNHDIHLRKVVMNCHSFDLKTIRINRQVIALCHYPMRSWDRGHYGSWNLHGHSHGTLDPFFRQYDVGVDNNDFCPISFDELKARLGE